MLVLVAVKSNEGSDSHKQNIDVDEDSDQSTKISCGGPYGISKLVLYGPMKLDNKRSKTDIKITYPARKNGFLGSFNAYVEDYDS